MSTTNKRPDEILLQVQDVHVAYGKAEVVHGASIDVRKGEFVVLLGRNGAGKSTLLHAISGLIPKKSGQVLFDGNDVTHSSPRDIVQHGVIQVLEGHRVFHSLSVEDNLLIGTYANAPKGDRSKLERIYDLFPGVRQPSAVQIRQCVHGRRSRDCAQQDQLDQTATSRAAQQARALSRAPQEAIAAEGAGGVQQGSDAPQPC